MARIVLRIRPAAVMRDLDIGLIRERATRLAGLDVEVQDTRLSDAPYVSVIVTAERLEPQTVAQLKAAFGDLPRMQARLWRRSGTEVPLERVDAELLEQAGES